METLKDGRCEPCEGGVARLGSDAIAELRAQVPRWRVVDDERLRRVLRFTDFAALMRFVNRMADLAEEQGHHPDFSVHWNELDVSVWTHAAGGLTDNDFVLAAKIDALLAAPES